jgi:hypothetical protein
MYGETRRTASSKAQLILYVLPSDLPGTGSVQLSPPPFPAYCLMYHATTTCCAYSSTLLHRLDFSSFLGSKVSVLTALVTLKYVIIVK